jgi:hypothetical protein
LVTVGLVVIPFPGSWMPEQELHHGDERGDKGRRPLDMTHRTGLGDRLSIDVQDDREEHRGDRHADVSQPALRQDTCDRGRADLCEKREEKDQVEHLGKTLRQAANTRCLRVATTRQGPDPMLRYAERRSLGGGKEHRKDHCGNQQGQEQQDITGDAPYIQSEARTRHSEENP